MICIICILISRVLFCPMIYVFAYLTTGLEGFSLCCVRLWLMGIRLIVPVLSAKMVSHTAWSVFLFKVHFQLVW